MILDGLLAGALAFGKNFAGILTRPYETYRNVVRSGSPWELIYIALALGVYFAVASLVKTAAFRPFLLTQQFLLLAGGAGLTAVVVIGSLWTIGRKFGGSGTLATVALGWSYTLVPTLVWFFTTSILYIIVPPPRTSGPLGIIFSIVYLVWSAVLFYWKVILAYLTLRFGLKLTFGRILATYALSTPVFVIWSIYMYRMGIFKIPFI